MNNSETNLCFSSPFCWVLCCIGHQNQPFGLKLSTRSIINKHHNKKKKKIDPWKLKLKHVVLNRLKRPIGLLNSGPGPAKCGPHDFKVHHKKFTTFTCRPKVYYAKQTQCQNSYSFSFLVLSKFPYFSYQNVTFNIYCRSNQIIFLFAIYNNLPISQLLLRP